MDGFLTFILIVVAIYFVFRYSFPVFFRLFIRRVTGFDMRNHQNHQRQKQHQNVAYKKGETTIISHGNERSEIPNDFGDYIDYKEIINNKP